MDAHEYPLLIANSIVAMRSLLQKSSSRREQLIFESGEALARYRAEWERFRESVADAAKTRSSKAAPQIDSLPAAVETIADQLCEMCDLALLSVRYCDALQARCDLLEIEIEKLKQK
jgi:hypothetical protein